jgi:hypothetical protein
MPVMDSLTSLRLVPHDARVWNAFEDGRTVGTRGSEEGLIALDDEHPGGARITLESEIRFGGETASKTVPFAITCGLYGWFVHTRYFSSETDAREAFAQMKLELERMIDLLSSQTLTEDEARHAVFEAIEGFVERFPT